MEKSSGYPRMTIRQPPRETHFPQDKPLSAQSVKQQDINPAAPAKWHGITTIGWVPLLTSEVNTFALASDFDASCAWLAVQFHSSTHPRSPTCRRCSCCPKLLSTMFLTGSKVLKLDQHLDTLLLCLVISPAILNLCTHPPYHSITCLVQAPHVL